MTTYLLTLKGDSAVCQIENEADAEKLRAHGATVTACDDEQAMAPLLAIMHPQARGLMESGIVRAMERLGRAAERMALFAVDAGQVLHILPESEAREWEADGHTIRKLPPKKPGEFAPDHAYNLPKLAAHHETCPPKAADLFLHGPNEGRQAPPLSARWRRQRACGRLICRRCSTAASPRGGPWGRFWRGCGILNGLSMWRNHEKRPKAHHSLGSIPDAIREDQPYHPAPGRRTPGD